jgi:DNA-binding transcriptional ArsR family regulator
MTTAANVFNALSDPIRIEMVSRLSRGSSFTVGAISSNLGVTRQGARKHLWILEQAEVIKLCKKGRTTEVQLNPGSFTIIKEFISKLEHQWDQRLLALKELVEKKQTVFK